MGIYQNDICGRIQTDIIHSQSGPVRYALGQFDLAPLKLNYPSVDELISSNFEPVNGMVARLLRSGYVYIYIENGAKKQADEGGDDLPSYQAKWHIFYYHSPNPDAEGNISELGGLFVKQKIEENDDNHLVYQRFKNSNNSLVKRTYAFIPPTCSTIYIAFSAYEWSIHMLDTVMSDPKKRAKHMQKSGTTLAINESCAWPLQQFAGKKPTDDNLKNGSSEQFNTTLASFVQELNPANKAAKKSAAEDDSFLDKLLLSVTPSIPYSAAKIAQVHNTTKNKIEVGKVIALHDPIGISQDLAAFHGAVSISHAHEIMDNQYAYLTYQAIETQLGSALPHVDSLFSNQLHSARQTLIDFEEKVSREQMELQSTPIHQRDFAMSDASRLSAVKSRMSEDELRQLSKAYEFTQKHKTSDDQKAAVKALNPKFSDLRNEISINGKLIEQSINSAAQRVGLWNDQTGSGSVANYFDLLTEEVATSESFDKVRAIIHIFGCLQSMAAGLEASKSGKVQIDKILYPSIKKDAELRYPISAMTKAVASFIVDMNTVLGGMLASSFSEIMPARAHVLEVSNKFLKTLVSSPKTSQAFADDIKRLALTSSGGSRGAIKSVVNDIAKLHNQQIQIKRKTLHAFVKDLNRKDAAISAWTDSLLVKFYGSVLKQKIDVLSFDTADISLPKVTLQGVSGVAFISVLYGMFVTAPELKRLQSANTASAANIMGLSEIYYTVVMAEVGAFALNKNVDAAAAKLTVALLSKAKIPINLGLNVTSGTAGVAGKALGALKGVLKTTPIIGAFDAVTNYYQLLSYSERNDTNAAFFAGVSIAGGSLLMLSGILSGLATVGVVIAGAPIIAAVGIVLATIGVIGKIFAEDGQLETWVTNGFWGWNENWRGIPANYLYWGNVSRSLIRFEGNPGNIIENFPAQLEIAKLASLGEKSEALHGRSVTPKATVFDIKQYMHQEMMDYYYQIYTPQFKKTRASLNIILPGFTVGKSELEVKLLGRELILGSMYNDRMVDFTYQYTLLSDDPELWSTSNRPEDLLLKPGTRILADSYKVQYSYYPLGKEGGIEIIGEVGFGFFD